MMKNIFKTLGLKGIIAFITIFVILIFCIQNIETTSVDFLFWNIVELPKLNLILFSVFMGSILGFMLGWKFAKPKK